MKRALKNEGRLSMKEQPIGFRLIWSDYEGRRQGMGDPLPPKQALDFPSKEAARAAQRNLIGVEVVSTVVPVYMRAKTSRMKPLADAFGGLPIMHRPPR